MSPVLTIEQGKALVRLCREGRLYEVEDWIAAGKSVAVPAEIRRTPLQIAVEREFHSLVKLLARHESSQFVLNRALSDAVGLRNLAISELLLEFGAEITGVPLADVLLAWESSLIRLFLSRGADVVSGNPFTIAFCETVRTSLRPFVEFSQAHPEFAEDLQRQADRALRFFSREGD